MFGTLFSQGRNITALLVAFTLAGAVQSFASDLAVYELVLAGGQFNDGQAADLEDAVAADPENINARTQLLGYYQLSAFKSDEAREAKERHVLWLIENRPEAQITGLPFAHLDPHLNGSVYAEAMELWKKNLDLYSVNSAVLANAASFMLLHERDLAEKIYNQLVSLEPANPEWKERLSHLHDLDAVSYKKKVENPQSAQEALRQKEEAYALLAKDDEKFYALTELGGLAFNAGDTAKAADYANQLLAITESFQGDWNYGNAIHHGHTILGRVAVLSGQKDLAVYHLLESGKTKGSPQLNSFGPGMELAKELLLLGEKDSVKNYLTLCKQFWAMDRGALNRWIEDIDRKGTTSFQNSLMLFQ